MALKPEIIVAMSGGLDSSTVAALLIEQGYNVQGLTMRIWREDEEAGTQDIAAAALVCRVLGIAHHVVDLRDAFYEQVVLPFVHAYGQGRTPNPCVICNRRIKFDLLWQHAQALGAGLLATGHYARIEYRDGLASLWRGVDQHKDQSYFLHRLSQEQLLRTRFPLGDWHKQDVRVYAQARGLPSVERPESQDICFLRDGDYRRFLRQHLPDALRSGPIFDRHGTLLGEHQGLAAYTIGQRRGLGIAASEPLYVLQLDLARNALIVGYQNELGCDTLEAEATTYIAGEPPAEQPSLQVQIRYRSRPVPARLDGLGGERVRVSFERPLRDITPGQAAVFYQGDQVLGGGIIAQAIHR